MTDAIVFAVGLLFGITTARAGTIAARGQIRDPNAVFTVIHFVAMASTFALLAWGFVVLPWYWPIAAFIGISLVVGVIVLRPTWLFFYRAIPFTGLVTVAAATYCWYAWVSGRGDS
jgi:hypothetical protein